MKNKKKNIIQFLGHEYHVEMTTGKFLKSGGTAKQLVYSVIADLVTNKGYELEKINTTYLMGYVNHRVLGYKGIKAVLGMQATSIGKYLRDYRREIKF